MIIVHTTPEKPIEATRRLEMTQQGDSMTNDAGIAPFSSAKYPSILAQTLDSALPFS